MKFSESIFARVQLPGARELAYLKIYIIGEQYSVLVLTTICLGILRIPAAIIIISMKSVSGSRHILSSFDQAIGAAYLAISRSEAFGYRLATVAPVLSV